MKKKFIENDSIWILASILIFGIFSRIWISQFGFNHDFSMWKYNLELFNNGESFYAFEKYNYSPLWIHILHLLDSIYINLENSEEIYRLKIVIFLTIIDVLIFFCLLKNYSLKIGLIFFLNPISIFITGFHNQFDNTAVLLGFLAMLLYEKNNKEGRIILPLILLGISLCAKHIMFFFPIWLFFKEKNLSKKLLILIVPYSIFFISFAPYLNQLNYIIENVFLYKSQDNGPFWNMFTPYFLHAYIDKKTLFSIFIIILGFLLKNRGLLNIYLLYLLSIVIFSSAIANQYFAIPLIAIAIFWNWKYLIFTILCCIVFILDGDALNIKYFSEFLNWDLRSTRILYHPIIFILLIGFLETLLDKKYLYNNLNKIFKKTKKFIS